MSQYSKALNHLRVKKLTISEVTLVTALLLASGQVADLNGESYGLVFDADADTAMGAPSDDVINIKVNGAEDFRILANIFRALAGSVIETDTINETTAANGVVVDGVTLKDGAVKRSPIAVSANGAIAVPPGDTDYFITKAGVAAMTLVDPTATTHDGIHLSFISTTAQAHTLDNSAGSGFFSSGGGTKDVATWGGAIGDRFEIVAYQAKWYIVDSLNITLS